VDADRRAAERAVRLSPGDVGAWGNLIRIRALFRECYDCGAVLVRDDAKAPGWLVCERCDLLWPTEWFGKAESFLANAQRLAGVPLTAGPASWAIFVCPTKRGRAAPPELPADDAVEQEGDAGE